METSGEIESSDTSAKLRAITTNRRRNNNTRFPFLIIIFRRITISSLIKRVIKRCLRLENAIQRDVLRVKFDNYISKLYSTPSSKIASFHYFPKYLEISFFGRENSRESVASRRELLLPPLDTASKQPSFSEESGEKAEAER